MSVQATVFRPVRVEDIEVPEKFAEIIEGELVTMTPAGKYHNRISYKLQVLFDQFCRQHPELDYGGDNEGFLLRRNPDTLLSPGACLYRRRPELERIWLEFAPEIAVEILSPSNHPTEIVYERKTYFECGTEQFWLVDPGKKQIQFFHRDGRAVSVSGDEVIQGEGITQGLEINLRELFRER